MKTLASQQTTEALNVLIAQLEAHGADTRRHPQSLVVRSTTLKPLLNAVTTDRKNWTVQVTREVADAFDLQLWSTTR